MNPIAELGAEQGDPTLELWRRTVGGETLRGGQGAARRVERLLENPGIVRNRLKVESTVTNARAFLAVQDEFGSFAEYQWGFVGGKPRKNRRRAMSDIPARTEESDALSKDLKKRGFIFVGSTIIYAHMQATGMVNDHEMSCFRYKQCAALAKKK